MSGFSCLCLIGLALIQGVSALHWLSSSTLPDGGTVPGCLSHDVSLAWNYSLAPNEHLVDIEWYFQAQGQSPSMVAVLAGGNFLLTAPFAGRSIEFVDNAGLHLTQLVADDAGVYSVHVNVDVHGNVPTRSQNVTLLVSEPPVTSDGRLHVQLLPTAVYREVSHDFHVLLSCGTFLSLGNPPVTAVWRTPSGQILPTTSSENGTFYLRLDNPVATGDYICLVQPQSPPLACVDNDSPLHDGATTRVDGVEVRLLLLEAAQQALREDNLQLQQHVHNLNEENHRLGEDVTVLQGQVTNLTQENEHLRQQNTDLSNQVQNLTEKVNYTFYLFALPDSCRSAKVHPTGVHEILIGILPVKVYCDQDTDNGGWTVIQRRLDGSVEFYRNWTEHEEGFGDVHGEYWLGLGNIYMMTSSANYTLRVDLEDFSGNTAYAQYSHFSVSGPETNYTLRVSGYSGTAGDSGTGGLSYDNNMQFSTRDRDHDERGDIDCASTGYFHGGWWYRDCGNTNLNGPYRALGSQSNNYERIVWYAWKQYESLKRTEMKIRPV